MVYQLTECTPLNFVQSIEKANRALLPWQKRTLKDHWSRWDPLLQQMLTSPSLDLLSSLENWERQKQVCLKLLNEVRGHMGEGTAPSQPFGLVSVYSDLEDPLIHFFLKILPALAWGNAVFSFYPLGLDPFVKALSAEVEKITPPDLLTFFISENESFLELGLIHPAVKAVSFAGTTERGLKVKSMIADSFKPLYLEMSSRAFALIHEDFDFELHGQKVFELLTDFSSPARHRPSRIFVVESIYERFVSEFNACLPELLKGKNPPLVKMEILESEKRQLQTESEAKFLNVPFRDTEFLAISEFPNCSALQQESFLGPWVTFTRAKYAHEAVKFLNTTGMGFSGSVWGTSETKLKRSIHALEASFVTENKIYQPSFTLKIWNMKKSLWGFGGQSYFDLFNRKEGLFAQTRLATVKVLDEAATHT